MDERTGCVVWIWTDFLGLTLKKINKIKVKIKMKRDKHVYIFFGFYK
jgi:hypothetical protein